MDTKLHHIKNTLILHFRRSILEQQYHASYIK